MWAQLSFVLSQITRLIDGQTTFSWLDRDAGNASAVKIGSCQSLLTVVRQKNRRQRVHFQLMLISNSTSEFYHLVAKISKKSVESLIFEVSLWPAELII